MKYLTTKEVASKWNMNDRRVRVLCEEGRVEGAFKVGKTWMWFGNPFLDNFYMEYCNL